MIWVNHLAIPSYVAFFSIGLDLLLTIYSAEMLPLKLWAHGTRIIDIVNRETSRIVLALGKKARSLKNWIGPISLTYYMV